MRCGSYFLQDGVRAGSFKDAAGAHRVTAVAFDQNKRRIVISASDGSVTMWNFNNGQLLRRYTHKHEQARAKFAVRSMR